LQPASAGVLTDDGSPRPRQNCWVREHGRRPPPRGGGHGARTVVSGQRWTSVSGERGVRCASRYGGRPTVSEHFSSCLWSWLRSAVGVLV
jgi:hypothetical protein